MPPPRALFLIWPPQAGLSLCQQAVSAKKGMENVRKFPSQIPKNPRPGVTNEHELHYKPQQRKRKGVLLPLAPDSPGPRRWQCGEGFLWGRQGDVGARPPAAGPDGGGGPATLQAERSEDLDLSLEGKLFSTPNHDQTCPVMTVSYLSLRVNPAIPYAWAIRVAAFGNHMPQQSLSH